jgi:hypothetical protein
MNDAEEYNVKIKPPADFELNIDSKKERVEPLIRKESDVNGDRLTKVDVVIESKQFEYIHESEKDKKFLIKIQMLSN